MTLASMRKRNIVRESPGVSSSITICRTITAPLRTCCSVVVNSGQSQPMLRMVADDNRSCNPGQYVASPRVLDVGVRASSFSERRVRIRGQTFGVFRIVQGRTISPGPSAVAASEDCGSTSRCGAAIFSQQPRGCFYKQCQCVMVSSRLGLGEGAAPISRTNSYRAQDDQRSKRAGFDVQPSCLCGQRHRT